MGNRRGISDKIALELLGGCNKSYKKNRINYYWLNDGNKITIKFSHLYDDGIGYWFGITPSAINKYMIEKISYMCFILGYEGVLKLPIRILNKYINNADISKNSNGDIKHYHIRLEYDENIIIYNSVEKFNVNEYLFYDEDIINSDLMEKSIDQIREEAARFKDFDNPYIESKKRSKKRKESKAQKKRVAILEDHTCQVCGFKEEYTNIKGKKAWIIHVDHIVDKAKGGGETLDNLWVLCPNCHAKKTYGVIEVDVTNRVVKEKGMVIKIKDNHLNWRAKK